MELNKSIQLEREIEEAGTSSKTHYGQFVRHPKDVHKFDNQYTSNQKNITIIDYLDTIKHIIIAETQIVICYTLQAALGTVTR